MTFISQSKKNFILYRKMSISEFDNVSKKGFQVLGINKADFRKWFSESLIVAARFKNPYFDEKQTIMKINISSDFQKYIKRKSVFLDKNQKCSFYQNTEYQNSEIIVCPAHLSVTELFNYGFLPAALNNLNDRILNINELEMDTFAKELLQQFFDLKDYEDLTLSGDALDYGEFYIQLPIDLSLASLKYKKLFVEGLNQVITERFLSNNRDLIEAKNNGKMACTLKVQFNPDFFKTSYFQNVTKDNIIALTVQDIIKINYYIRDIQLVDIDLEKANYSTPKRFIGNNLYKAHEQKQIEPQDLIPLSKEQLANLYELLKQDLKMADIIQIMPIFEKLIGCFQMDPKHIYDVATHVILSVNKIDEIIASLPKIYNGFTDQEIFWFKLALILHDIGKPFCDASAMKNRYGQFKHHLVYAFEIFDGIFANLDNMQCDIIKLLMKVSATNGKSSQNNFFVQVCKILQDQNVESENFIQNANKLVYGMFILKIANFSTMQHEKFNKNYLETIEFLGRWQFFKRRVLRIDDIDSPFAMDILPDLYNSIFKDIVVGNESINNVEQESSIPILKSILGMNFDKNDYSEDYTLKSKRYKSYNVYRQMDLCECIDYINENENLDLLMSAIETTDYTMLITDRIHGIYHNEKVALFIFIIASLNECSREDIRILLKSAFYHDIGRIDERSEKFHGRRSVELYQKFESESITASELKYISFIMEGHSLNDNEFEDLLKRYDFKDKVRALKLLQMFKDADALDRVRISMPFAYTKLNPNYLRNPKSYHLLKFAHQINELYFTKAPKIAESLSCAKINLAKND